MKTLLRVLALAACALLCAALVGLVALFVQSKTLPPSDLAYGMPFGTYMKDPFVLIVLSEFVLVGATLGFAVGSWLLWKVRLSKAAPVVLGVAAAAAAMFAPIFGPLSAVPALIAAVGAMVWCRSQAASKGWAR